MRKHCFIGNADFFSISTETDTGRRHHGTYVMPLQIVTELKTFLNDKRTVFSETLSPLFTPPLRNYLYTKKLLYDT